MPGPRDVVHGAAAVRVRPGLPLRHRGRGLRFGDPTARRALTVLSAALGYAHKDHKLLDPLPIGMPDKIPAGDRWLTRLQAVQLLHAALGFRKAAALGEAILHPHILRHTFATSAVMDAMPCGKVAKALGTTGRVVEDVSGHPSPKHLRGVVESVSGRRRQPKGIT